VAGGPAQLRNGERGSMARARQPGWRLAAVAAGGERSCLRTRNPQRVAAGTASPKYLDVDEHKPLVPCVLNAEFDQVFWMHP